MQGLPDAVRALSEWYLRVHRALPWRETRDPYRIWVSEVMLQQTTVGAVIPYFERFLGRFPTVEALATAPLPDVLAAWSGLGYYTRARNLHRGAQAIARRFGGKMPRSAESLLEIPGIGPYTAGAIASIAFDLPAPIVDGNVQRVFARVYGVRKQVGLTEVQKLFWAKAREWVERAGSPRVLNQALMELGATVCVKGTPRCDLCPLKRRCSAFENGWQAELPVPKPRRAMENLWWAAFLFESDGNLFLKKNGPGEWWADLWDFPRIEATSARARANAVRERIAATAGVLRLEEGGVRKHTVTHHRIEVLPVTLRLASPDADWEGEWRPWAEVDKLPISALARKCLGAFSGSPLVVKS